MHFLSHLTYPYIMANGVALALGRTIPLKYNLLIIFFSLFPDIDYIFDGLKQLWTKRKYVIPETHHQSMTHWPITYLPLLTITLLTGNPFFIIATGTIYTHLIMDSFVCNQGVMWLYPFSKKWANFYADKTKKKFGLKWNEAYSKLTVASVDKVAFVIFLVHGTIILI